MRNAALPVEPILHPRARDAELLADEAKYCSFGDTVHYSDPPKIFDRCEGSYLYDAAGTPFLDLQMWYSAVNFGYANKRLNDVLKRQIDTLPQVASQYLHPTKIELAKIVAQDAERKWGMKGRVHFNVGGAQSVEDSLKLVRNASGGKSLMFAFEGGYHGRTLGASAITSSPSSSSFRITSAARKACRRRNTAHIASPGSSGCSRPNTTACGIRRSASANTRRSMSNQSRAPAAT